MDTALIVSAAGVLASFPFREHVLGGILFSGFNAATIGGLADSFAVGALFGNPLKIKWPAFMGTRVIERNRSRLINELGDMVQHELLTTANIQQRLEQYSISAILIGYLKERGGQQHITEIAQRLAEELASRTDEHELGEGLRKMIFRDAGIFRLADLFADLGEWMIRSGYDEPILHFLLDELVRIVNTERFRLVIQKLARSALDSYEHGKFRRQFVNQAAGLEPEQVSGKIQAKIADFLTDMKSPSHPERAKLKAKLQQYISNLRSDPDWRAALEKSEAKLLKIGEEHIRLDRLIREELDALLRPSLGSDEAPNQAASVLQGWIGRKVGQGISKLESDSELQKTIDHKVKGYLLQWVEQRHSLIAKVVTDKLNTYSEEELIEMVRDKAGRDLQYIRLNGLAIGGVIGVLLYLVSFLTGGVFR
ncbi:DUF445 domain-containing protein [Paenibacillus pinistramenti]|uniref:DUF445 domain-containing protein n=1 Tax=Paenibacillus pinistramenti TaxID=1768003 RepID=UPI00193A05E5|nr:DUF445 domain-containing protein [Paenibacillus pinistramenti]